jgi:aryl-alcohol dehydrogenase-like predicted oxidoreductase
LQKRRFGRTGLQVSIVGFGGTWISELSKDQAVSVVRKAFDLGINYFDTAKLDGDSEEKIGAAFKDVRDKCVIATKTGSRTKHESLEDFKSSLRRLQTDKLDIIQLHGIDDEKTLAKAMGSDGVLQTCKKARSEGYVDYIGITGHKPRVLVKASRRRAVACCKRARCRRCHYETLISKNLQFDNLPVQSIVIANFK